MTTPDPTAEGLVAPEGVDEGSAASTGESAADHDDSGTLEGGRPGGSPDLAQQAAPDEPSTSDVAAGGGPGQELSAGEG